MGLSLGSFIAKIRPEDKNKKKVKCLRMDFVSQESDRRTTGPGPVGFMDVQRLHNESTDCHSEHKLCDIIYFGDHLKVDSFLLIEVRKSFLLSSATFGHFFAYSIQNQNFTSIYIFKILLRAINMVT